GATANYWYGENMGDFTVTGNWSTNGSTNVTDGDRGNVVNNNVTVANGAWPAGAQAVIAAAGPGGQSPGDDTGALRGVGSHRCLDVDGASQSNGAQVHIWDCHGRTNQQWTATSAGELRVNGNTCLDVNGAGTADGTAVIIWDCNGQNNQRWTLTADGSVTAVGANKCLDVSGYGT